MKNNKDINSNNEWLFKDIILKRNWHWAFKSIEKNEKKIEENINKEQKIINQKVEKHDKDINKHYNDIRKLNRNVKVLIWVWVTISSLLLFNLIYWIYESYFHTNQIQYNFEITKNNFENDIKEFKKEIDNLKEDNKKLKENIKNELEKDIYKTILQTNLKN